MVLDQLQGFLGGGGGDIEGKLLSSFDTGFFASVYTWIKVFVYFAVAVALGMAFYKMFYQYKVRVTIKGRVGGGGIEVYRTRAKVVTDNQNKRKLVMWKRIAGKTLTCPVPPSIYKGKEGKHDHYELWLDDNNQIHPVEDQLTPVGHPEADMKAELKMKIRPQETNAWERLENRSLQDKFRRKDMIEKYLPAGILIISMMTAFLIWFFATKELGSGMSNMAAQFQQIASSCTVLR